MVMTAIRPSTRERPKAGLRKNCMMRIMQLTSAIEVRVAKKMFKDGCELGS